jgi:predicted dehydrogenase
MKVLIIGLGSIAKKHISALSVIQNDAQVYALRSSTAAEPYENVINLFEQTELSKHQFDFCIISSPTALHAENIDFIAGLKIPMFIEKPLFSDLNQQELVAKIKGAAIKTYVACNLRFLEALNYVKEHFLNQHDLALNEVNVYCGSYLPDWRPGQDFRKSYSANAAMGGGVHIDLIHEIDYVYWLFGQPGKVDKNFKSNSSLSIDAIDYARYNLEYDSFEANIVLNYYRRDAKRFIELVFREYTIYVNVLTNEVFKNGELIFESTQRIGDTYETQLSYFIANLESESFNDISEAFAVLSICLA